MLTNDCRSTFSLDHVTRLKSGLYHTKIISLLIVTILLSTQPAYAYIDPGATSVLLQALIAGVATAVAGLTYYYQQLKELISRWFSRRRESHSK